MHFNSLFFFMALTGFSTAKDIVITVGVNNDTVFDPQIINATVGDAVRFLFVAGNHSVTQGSFALPCIPIHEQNETINGFDSGLRLGTNGTGQTDFVIPIGAANDDSAIWLYDSFPGSCGLGHIAVINVNNSSPENFDAAVRNAERLNGTEATQSSSLGSIRPSSTSPSSSTASGGSNSGNGTGGKGNYGIQILVPIAASGMLAVTGGLLLSF